MSSRAVGFTKDLPAGRAMRAFVDGQDLVVWRTVSGKISAWDNRCPHRGMALSHGFVRGEDLACLYHGWHYNCSGACSLIPSHPDLTPPSTIRSTSFYVIEDQGVIWVSLADDAQAETQVAGYKPLRSFEVEATVSAEDGARFDGMILCNPLSPGRTLVLALAKAQAEADEMKHLSRQCEALRQVWEGRSA